MHGHVSGGAPLQAVQEVLLGTKPEVVYIPTQNATETALLSILSSINQGSPQQDVGSAADASIYQWPAASEAGQEQAYASLAGNGIQIVPSRLFVFSRVRILQNCAGCSKVMLVDLSCVGCCPLMNQRWMPMVSL